MTLRETSRPVLLTLFVGAVLFGIGVIYRLSDRVDEIHTAEQSDPLWIGSQLQFELLRLENHIGELALGMEPEADLALRFDVAWSRINILQEGKVSRMLAKFGIDQSVLTELEHTFASLEPQIRSIMEQNVSDETRRQRATNILGTLDGYELTLKEFLVALAQAKTHSLSEFRSGLLSLSNAIAYLSISILVIFGVFISLLLIELKGARRTESRMRALAEEATSASRLKSNFMSVVSHELRTPLTSLLGGLTLLRARAADTITDKSALKLLEVASRNGDRLLTLVNDILDAQALSEGKVSIKLETTDLNEIVAASVENCRSYAENLGVSYSLSTPSTAMLVSTDSVRAEQVLTNLISNAAKFTSAGDVVEISVKRNRQKVRIEVVDHGIGIPDALQSDIFVPFHQINPGTTGSNKSSGLGLSIAKQLMDLLGGKVGFDSVEGEGSVFWIELDLLSRNSSPKSNFCPEPLTVQN